LARASWWCASRPYGPHENSQEAAAEKLAARTPSWRTGEIATGIDYSQEVGLPVEWEEYTLTGEEAAKRIREQLKKK
jgi:hypothetical protein